MGFREAWRPGRDSSAGGEVGGGLGARGREAESSGRGAWPGLRESASQGGVVGPRDEVSRVGLGVPGGSHKCDQ